MEVITTHCNADFDALASMVTVAKLYPQAKLVLPGSSEKQVRRFLLLCGDLIPYFSDSECNLDSIDKVIIVDTRIPGRLGKLESVVRKPGVKIHVFDHHPRTKYDVRADKELSCTLGATVTLLLRLIKSRRIKLKPLEVSLLALGIYEETGCLTYPTTTSEDIAMLNFLFQQGASLDFITAFLHESLTQVEKDILSLLLKQTKVFDINGLKIAIAKIDCERHEANLAALANKLMRLGNYHAMFLVIISSKLSHIIARSKVREADVNSILKDFNGGGHTTAASAKITKGSGRDLEKEILFSVRKKMKLKVSIKDILRPAVKVEDTASINDALKLLEKKKVTSLLVMRKGKIAGTIGRLRLSKMIYKGLGGSKVKGFMSNKVKIADKKVSFYKVEEDFLKNDAELLAVLENKRLVGMITKADLVEVMCKKREKS